MKNKTLNSLPEEGMFKWSSDPWEEKIRRKLHGLTVKIGWVDDSPEQGIAFMDGDGMKLIRDRSCKVPTVSFEPNQVITYF